MLDHKEMTRYVYCPKCHSKAIRIRGGTYNRKIDEHQRITLGLYCMKCKALELDPNVPISDIILNESLQLTA